MHSEACPHLWLFADAREKAMGLSAKERSNLISKWIKPSSDHEQTQQDRAEAMVRAAIDASESFKGSTVRIYTKGSYPNNTNVRRDSDVDVVVELQDCIYYDYAPGVAPPAAPALSPYTGSWTPTKWRDAVKAALVTHFGATAIDSSGKIAIEVSAVAGSRPSADVVPSFKYQRYNDAAGTDLDVGSCVFPSDGGAKVVNWPQQQLNHGRALNSSTGGRYKNYVRALKNAENALAANGTLPELPSYFMECLVFNVPEATLKSGNLDDGFKATLVSIWDQLNAESSKTAMVEPNWQKYLFTAGKKWTIEDGQKLIQETWAYLGYGA